MKKPVEIGHCAKQHQKKPAVTERPSLKEKIDSARSDVTPRNRHHLLCEGNTPDFSVAGSSPLCNNGHRRDIGLPHPKTVERSDQNRRDTKANLSTSQMCPEFTEQDCTTLAQWTAMRLDSYAVRVREGKDLLAAADFCRYLNNSGILKLIPGFRSRVSEILLDVGDAFNAELGRNTEAEKNISVLELLLAKIDLLTEHVRTISPPKPKRTRKTLGARSAPALRVISGGVNL